MVQMRSTICQAPSWQYSSRVGSAGENCRWFSQSVLCSIRVSIFRPQINGEHRHRQFGREARAIIWPLLAGSPRLVAVMRPRLRRCRHTRRRAGVALDEGAGAEGFIGVDGDDAGAAREIGELAVLPGVEIDAPERGEERIVGGPGVIEIGVLWPTMIGLAGPVTNCLASNVSRFSTEMPLGWCRPFFCRRACSRCS
jgi:hypothetical protein